MPINHKKRWTLEDLIKIKSIAKTLQSKEAMYKIAPDFAKQLGRTEAAVCKKIEEENGWYWAK